jgi:NAD(P)-dependent dehydrogenase (short-subunit alcohol dehydrogenase family)
MRRLEGRVAMVTGSASGIGLATVERLSSEGAVAVVSDVQDDAGERAAAAIRDGGGEAMYVHLDVTDEEGWRSAVEQVVAERGRLDILVNNAGLNIVKRSWRQLEESGADEILHGNLSSAFYCVIAALPIMRAQKDGVLIHTASWAGRFISPMSGPAYTAAKHGVVAMSHSINGEECMNGIRSSVVCPAEVATPILDKRPVPVSAEERARMLQSEDLGDLICYIATLPPHVCLNEVLISPTWNRGYVATLQQPHLKV